MKRLLAMLLTLCMVLSMFPLAALATEETAPQEETTPVEETTPQEEIIEEETNPDEGIAVVSDVAVISDDCSNHTPGTVNGADACLAADGTLPICAGNFPDANFRSYISSEIDADGDGYLNAEELATGEIDCREREIASLQGIGYFAELYTLRCQENNLTSLDVSNNPALVRLVCYYNNLTALDLSNNTALEYLYCDDNNLTELDVSMLSVLEVLDCSYNYLTALDVSNNSALEQLYCYGNQLAELDLSSNTALSHLECYSNQLTELDVSSNPALANLTCYNNQLTELDLSNNPELSYLSCHSNQLAELDLSNNTALFRLECYNNQLTSLDLSMLPDLSWVICSNNSLLELKLPQDVTLANLACDSQYWYGDTVTTVNESGEYEVDMSQFTDPAKIAEIGAYCEVVCDSDTGIATFASHPDEGGYYYYYTIEGGGTMQVCINIAQDDDGNGGGSGGDGGYDDSADWENAPSVALGDTFTVQLTEDARYAYYTITPDRDFVSKIYSSNENGMDPVMYLYQLTEDGWQTLERYDDSNGLNFLCTYEMKAGVTYGLEIYAYGDLGEYTVTVDESEIVGITILNELDVYEYTEGYYEDGIYHYQDWVDRLEYQVTLSNGQVVEGRGWNFEYEWNGETVSHDLHLFMDGSAWTVGNSYEAEISIAGIAATVTVNIIAPPENITLEVDPVRCPSYNGDYYYGYNEETGEYEEYIGYPWIYCVDGTVTIDGTAYEINNGFFEYNGVEYQLNAVDSQSPVAPWEVGGIYDATVSIMGAEAGCSVEIYYSEGGSYEEDFISNAPAVESMTVLTPDTDYSVLIAEEGEARWFTFTPAESGNYVFAASSNNLDTRGYLFDAELNLLHENDDANNYDFSIQYTLEAGKTYVYAAKMYGSDTGSFTVRLEQCAGITGIKLTSTSIPEGAWCESALYDGEVYHYYYWQAAAVTQVTFSDGGTATGNGNGVEYNGVTYTFATNDSQYEELWVAGSTYNVSLSCDGVSATSTVSITPCPIKSVTVNNVTIPENEYYNNWANGMKYTVTFKDGGKVTGTGYYFEYKGNTYMLSTINGESFEPGTATACKVIIGNTVKDVTVTVRALDETIPTVENVRVTSVAPTSIKIAFDKVSGASKYEIYVNGAYWGSTTKANYTISGLTTGRYYQINVAAVKTAGGKTVGGPMSSTLYQSCYTDIKNYYVAMEYTSTVYDGTVKEPTVTLKKSSSGKAMASEHYEVNYMAPAGIGQGVVAVWGVGEYGGVIYKSYKVLPQQVTGVEIDEITENSVTISFNPVEGADEYWVYQGSTRKAKITGTTYTFTGLKAGTTYNFSVRANTIVSEFDLENYNPYVDDMPEIRTADYTGAASAAVSAKPVYDLTEGTVTLKYETKPYTGKAITNTVTVKNAEGKTLKNKTDYTVSYENNKQPGEVTVTVTGKGKYAGQLQDTFVIVPKAPTGVKAAVVDGTSIRVTYKAAVGATEYSVFANGEYVGTTSGTEYVITGLTAGTKYSVTVAAGIELDFGRVVYGAKSSAASATPKHNMSICTLVLDRAEFTYTGKAHKPTVTVYGYEGEVLTQGTDYTVSYVDSKNTGRATLKVTGKGAYTGTNSTYYYIYPAQVTNLKVASTTATSVKISWTKASTSSTKYYNVYVNGELAGRTTSGSYTIKNLTLGEVYSVYVIPEKTLASGTYYGLVSDTIEVWPGTGIGKYKVTLEYTKAIYEGAPLCPSVVVKTSAKASAVTLVQGVDYTVEYVANNAPGKMSVIIKGIGVYTGTITKTITVSPAKVTGVTATATGAKTIHVEFDAVEGATQYWVYVNGSKKATVTETSCDIAGLAKNKTYKVTVKAVTKVGSTNYAGALSDAFSVKTLSA